MNQFKPIKIEDQEQKIRILNPGDKLYEQLKQYDTMAPARPQKDNIAAIQCQVLKQNAKENPGRDVEKENEEKIDNLEEQYKKAKTIRDQNEEQKQKYASYYKLPNKNEEKQQYVSLPELKEQKEQEQNEDKEKPSILQHLPEGTKQLVEKMFKQKYDNESTQELVDQGLFEELRPRDLRYEQSYSTEYIKRLPINTVDQYTSGYQQKYINTLDEVTSNANQNTQQGFAEQQNINCSECDNCNKCIECVGCDNSTGCYKSSHLSNCVGCYNCENLINATDYVQNKSIKQLLDETATKQKELEKSVKKTHLKQNIILGLIILQQAMLLVKTIAQ